MSQSVSDKNYELIMERAGAIPDGGGPCQAN